MRDILDRISEFDLTESQKSAQLMDKLKAGDPNSLEFAQELGIPPAVVQRFSELSAQQERIIGNPEAAKLYVDAINKIETYLDKVLGQPISRRGLFKGAINFIALVNNLDTIQKLLKQPKVQPAPQPAIQSTEPQIKGMDITEIYSMIVNPNEDMLFNSYDTALWWIETTEKFKKAGIRSSRLKELIQFFNDDIFKDFPIWDIEEYMENSNFVQNALDSGELDEEHWTFIQELWDFISNWTPGKKKPSLRYSE